MFYHLRSAKRLDVKMRQLAAKADGSQLAKLQELMAAIVGEAEEEDSQESTLGLSKTSSRQSLVAAQTDEDGEVDEGPAAELAEQPGGKSCCGNSAAKDSPPAALQSGNVAPPSEQPAAEPPCKKSKPAAEPPCKKSKSQKASTAASRKTQSKTAGSSASQPAASTRMGIWASRNLLAQEIKASRFSRSAPLPWSAQTLSRSYKKC